MLLLSPRLTSTRMAEAAVARTELPRAWHADSSLAPPTRTPEAQRLARQFLDAPLLDVLPHWACAKIATTRCALGVTI